MRAWLLVLILATPSSAWAAVGCSLANPEEDIAGFFPEVTTFTVNYVTYQRQDPTGWYALRAGIGEELDAVYETIDVPYALYTVDGPDGRLGYVFGVNQRGKYANLQVIAVTDAELALKQVYLQKIRSPEHEAFQSAAFLEALAAVPLADYPGMVGCYRDGACDDVPVRDPSGGAEPEDFRAVLRALAKLHLLSETLLRPGEPARPPTLAALAEWVAGTGGARLRGGTLWELSSQPAEAAALAPDADVVLLPDGRAVPLDVLARIPVLEVGDVAVIAVAREGGPAAVRLRDGERMLATGRLLLFGTRVLKDQRTDSWWSAATGACIYGARAGEQLEFVPGVTVVRASELPPDAVVFTPPRGG